MSREEIQERLWGDTAVDADAGVNFAVRRVREALGETAEESRYVETLPRLGYRFVGRIERPVGPEGDLPSQRAWLVGAAAGLLLALAGVVTLRSDPSGRVAPDDPTYAVKEARDAYLQGIYLLDQRTDEDRRRAAGFFREALTVDPDYAPAYVQLEVAERDVLSAEERTELLRTALDLDSQLASAHLGLGWLELERVRLPAARDAFESAVRLGPELVQARHGSALVHAALGDFDAALPRVEEALARDPGATMIFGDAFLIYFWAGRRVQAVAELEAALRLEPDERGVRWAATSYLVHAGRWQDAARVMEPLLPAGKALRSAPDDESAESHWRRQVEAFYEAKIEQVLARGLPPRDPGSVAECYLALGRYDEALDMLAQAVDQGWYSLPYLGVDPRWDAVRDDPRFQAVLDGLGLANRN